MPLSRLLTALFCLAAFARGQTQLFQYLDSPVPSSVIPQAIGDLDGDGDADLLVMSGVFVNDGHGRFTSASAPSLAFQHQRARLADMNGDGLLDVISVAAGAVRIDMNAGGLTFAGPVAGIPSLPAGFFPGNLAAGDVDGDGDADLLIATYAPGGAPGPMALWLNNGVVVLTSAPAASVPTGAIPTDQLFLRDLDGDGDLDALFAGPSLPAPLTVQMATNTAGVFTLATTAIWTGSAPYALEVGNFNGDALPDIALTGITGGAGVIAVILNSPTGFLPPVTTTVSTIASLLVAVDLNGNGVDELVQWVAGGSGGGVSVRAVGPTASVGPPTQTWPDLFLAGTPGYAPSDLDGDQDRDLIAWGAALMNDGAGSLVRVGGRVLGVAFYGGPQVGDLDGDGDPDALDTNSSGGLVTALNDGEGFFTPGWTGPAMSSTPLLHLFDRDGDGDADIFGAALTLQPGGNPPDVILDNAGGVFTAVATVAGTGNTSGFVAADFDGDTDVDLMLGRRGLTTFGNGITSPMLYVQKIAAAAYAAPVPIGGNHSTYDIDLGDFDGNGTIDVFQTNAIFTSTNSDPCVVYLNSGAASFTPVVQVFGGYYTAAGDLNGDGMTDLVVDGAVYFSAGAGGFTSGPLLASPLVAPAVLVDVDLDGDLDLVETPASVMINSGGGTFGLPTSMFPLSNIQPTTWGIPKTAVVDIDRDGDPDIIAPGLNVLMNTTRQLAHGSWPRPGRPASVDLYGTPGGAWFLFGSNGTANFSFPPWGTVMIDPASAQLGAMGLFTAAGPAAGTASFGVTLPNNPALVGWTTYWQAIEATQLRFTNRLTITVMGY